MSDIFGVSLTLAFLGGILSLISPCTVSIVPAFLAIASHDRKRLLRSSIVFFLGFSIVFVLLGLIASASGAYIAKAFGPTALEDGRSLLVAVAGIFMIAFGLMSIFGKGFSGLKVNSKVNGSPAGLFLFGMAFAFGWSPCVGPILGSILTIAATLDFLQAGLLLFSYSLGMWSLLFALGFFYDRFSLGQTIFRERELKLDLLGKKMDFELVSLVSGLLLIVFGMVFLWFRSALFISSLNIFNSVGFFISAQNAIIGAKGIFGTVDLVVLIIIVVFAVLFMYGHFFKKKPN